MSEGREPMMEEPMSEESMLEEPMSEEPRSKEPMPEAIISEEPIEEAIMTEELLARKKVTEEFVQNLLAVMPAWHSQLVRPFKDMLNKEMSLETYYCLQTVRTSGIVRMTELAQQLKIPKQQVTKLVDKLSSHDFVERVFREDDRRAIWIRLTPKAMKYLDEYYLKNTGFIKSLEEQLTAEELRELNHAVETIGRILPGLR